MTDQQRRKEEEERKREGNQPGKPGRNEPGRNEPGQTQHQPGKMDPKNPRSPR